MAPSLARLTTRRCWASSLKRDGSGSRRGGRARLKASDSKSDRGPEGPSGVQILSPPPNYLTPQPQQDACGRGGVTERPKVRHWKCRARVTPVPWVQIPPPPPFLRRGRTRRGGSGAL